MQIEFLGLDSSLENAEIRCWFDEPLTDADLQALRQDGFLDSVGFSVANMEWQWFSWLKEERPRSITDKVDGLVERGVEMQSKSKMMYMRPQADLYLLHCAIFGSNQDQLIRVAKSVMDIRGVYGKEPKDDGELYAACWCGMLKHWILGDLEQAKDHCDQIWSSYRPPWFAAATKPLTTRWISGDWPKFVKAQEKDFEKLWARGRKSGPVKSETKEKIEVIVQRFPLEQRWCWAHVGLALLAYRKGIEVATDPFWFPPHALKVIDSLK